MDYNQYKGKPFQVISRLNVRYTGIFQDIDQESQTLCLSEVYNHGTEDRPSARVLPGSSQSLGWVRFHTNSIESLALVENYVPPSQEEAFDPILASVSQTGPSQNKQERAPVPAGNGLASLPPKPVGPAASANAALDRVQKSLNDLSMDGQRRRNKPQPPAVPDAEFDFTKGNERFQKEREAHKEAVTHQEEDAASPADGTVDLGEPENTPHPSAIPKSPDAPTAPLAKSKTASYSKSSFFDNISSDTSRVSRADERHRNFDTFGEAGGQPNAGGMRGGAAGGGSGFGHQGDQGQRGGYGGYNNQQRGGGGRGRGGRGRGGYHSNLNHQSTGSFA